MSDVRTLVLAGSAGPLAELAAQEPGVERVDDLEACLEALGSLEATVAMIVIGPEWTRPLAAVQRIRDVSGEVGLAMAVARDQVDAFRTKLALLPRAGDVGVVAVDAGRGDLWDGLTRVATTARRRRQVRGALDAINDGLAARPALRTAPARPTTVSENHLAALVRHAPDTILAIDPAGQVVSINDAGQRTLRVDLATAEGQRLPALFAPEDAGRLTALLDGAGSGDARIDDEVPVTLRDGQELLLSATAAAIRDDTGALAGFVIIARDVTDERRSERRLRSLQKAESLATLASGVAHDFNNLLVQIQVWADLARGDVDDRDLVSEALGNILEATHGAAELARAMLAYGGRGDFEVGILRIDDLLDRLRPLLTALVPAKLELVMDLGAGAVIEADATQVRQVVLNLVTNAAEAIGDRPGTISVRTATRTLGQVAGGGDGHHLGAGTYAVIEVEDTGPGVPPEVRDRLFEPFFTTKFKGRGLGLAASHGIVRAHGGAMTVDPEPGSGARFRVLLPVSEEAP